MSPTFGRKRRWVGHAVLRAKELVGNEPFAVVLSDDVIDADIPCIRQLLDVYEFFGASVLALMEVPRENISAYGVVDAEPVAHNGTAIVCFEFATWSRSRKPRMLRRISRSSAVMY